jgi:hypothetical protein
MNESQSKNSDITFLLGKINTKINPGIKSLDKKSDIPQKHLCVEKGTPKNFII